jgi:lysocardiolipin and lysophospholipid acyltransferase
MKDIPLDDHDKFDLWMRNQWQLKDALMEQYLVTGRFPENGPTNGAVNGSLKEEFIETEVKLAHWWEVGNIFVVLAALALIFKLLARAWESVIYGSSK